MRRLAEIGPHAANMGPQELHTFKKFRDDIKQHLDEQNDQRRADAEAITDDSVGYTVQFIDTKLGVINTQLTNFYGPNQAI